jgi:acyl-CoA synthetase (NDP forming)/GNAT superfamily N-acetyltransferase
VLRDGGTAHLRPIRPDDAVGLVRFHGRLSDQTIYNRSSTLYRDLTPRDVERFTVVDHVDRVALVATVADEIIGVVRYERLNVDEAEVAFNIEDAHQGRGLGSVFLEHIAAAARERGISRFIADVLPSNRAMLRVFEDAGYVVRHEYDDGVVTLEFGLAPTEDTLAVREAREHRAESRSVERLLRPASVAVVGASRSTHSIGHTVLRHIVDGGFTGRVHAVNPLASEIAGVPSYATVNDVPDDVDLAVVAVPAREAEAVVRDCAQKGVLGIVVMSSGFAETGDEGAALQQRLVRLARGSGMRVIGPSSFGVVQTRPDVSLNASLSPVMPPHGRVGFFSQSGALGVALLDNVVRRGLGISSFVSAGNRVDVSGNDLMQYWEEDPGTDAVMLYLESIGNPRKFSRIARRLARRKPVVVVKSGRSRRAPPHGHLVRESRAPAAAVDALFEQAGAIRVDTIHQLFDVGQLVANQPLPAGRRVAVVGNSDALGVLAVDACEAAGLEVVGEPRQLGPQVTAADFEKVLAEVFADPDVDSVVSVFIPPLETRDEDVASVLATAAAAAEKTVVSTFLGMRGVPEALRAPSGRGSVPSYPTPEDAVQALSAVTDYAQWRATPPGVVVEPPDLDAAGARALVTELLGDGDEVLLTEEGLGALLGCYGIELWATEPATDVDLAAAAAARLGYPVALKALVPHLRHRSDLGGVRLNIDDEVELRGAFDGMLARLGREAAEHFVLQRMAPTGVACVVGSVEDGLFGPVVSFGLGGVATELLADRSYAIPPIADTDLHRMVRSVGAAPLLFGHRGADPVDVAALEDLLARVAHLADDLPDVADLELNPVLVSGEGCRVLAASGRLARPRVRADRGPRALPG